MVKKTCNPPAIDTTRCGDVKESFVQRFRKLASKLTKKTQKRNIMFNLNCFRRHSVEQGMLQQKIPEHALKHQTNRKHLLQQITSHERPPLTGARYPSSRSEISKYQLFVQISLQSVTNRQHAIS